MKEHILSREFIRFGVDYKISPILVSSEQMVLVFKAGLKSQQNNQSEIVIESDDKSTT